jgi:beta-phosphoglucomutase-like phosphatase (HAD superfamily)
VASRIKCHTQLLAWLLHRPAAVEHLQHHYQCLQFSNAAVVFIHTGSASPISPQWLAAVAATLGVPISSCLTVASSNDLVNAASAAGMVAVAIPRKLAYAASYPAAAAKFEGLGAGYATWQKLSSLWVRQQQSK